MPLDPRIARQLKTAISLLANNGVKAEIVVMPQSVWRKVWETEMHPNIGRGGNVVSMSKKPRPSEIIGLLVVLDDRVSPDRMCVTTVENRPYPFEKGYPAFRDMDRVAQVEVELEHEPNRA